MGKCPICNTEGYTEYQRNENKEVVAVFKCAPCSIEWLELLGGNTPGMRYPRDICDCTLCIADGGTECKGVQFVNEEKK